jgi:hypothetical protein
MLLEFEGAGKFRLITNVSTIERDIALSNLLRSSGAQAAMLEALTASEEPDARVFNAVAASGRLFDLLGAALMPLEDAQAPPRLWWQKLLRIYPPASVGHGGDPLKWTPEIAANTAERLKHVTTPQAKQLLTLAVVELVKAFFLAGLHSLVTSRNSLRAIAERVEARPAGANGASMNSETGH